MNPFTLRPFRFDRAAINDWNRRNRRGIEAYSTRDDPTPCPGCGRPTKALTEQCQDCERSDA